MPCFGEMSMNPWSLSSVSLTRGFNVSTTSLSSLLTFHDGKFVGRLHKETCVSNSYKTCTKLTRTRRLVPFVLFFSVMTSVLLSSERKITKDPFDATSWSQFFWHIHRPQICPLFSSWVHEASNEKHPSAMSCLYQALEEYPWIHIQYRWYPFLAL